MILDFLVMKTSRFNESQIIKAIKEHKGGRKAEDIVRGLRTNQETFYKWKQKYVGLEASDVKRLNDLDQSPHALVGQRTSYRVAVHPTRKANTEYSIEPFNRTYRIEVLNSYLFSSIQEVLTTKEKFQHNYNHNRPHGSLNDLPPRCF